MKTGPKFKVVSWRDPVHGVETLFLVVDECGHEQRRFPSEVEAVAAATLLTQLAADFDLTPEEAQVIEKIQRDYRLPSIADTIRIYREEREREAQLATEEDAAFATKADAQAYIDGDCETVWPPHPAT